MMRLALGVLIWLVATPALAAKNPCASRDTDARAQVSSELLTMYKQETNDTRNRVPDKARLDREREQVAKRYADKGWLCTSRDRFHAAWVMRNSEDIDTLTDSFNLAKEAMEKRVPRAPWLVAYLYDRRHVFMGRLQRYGSMSGMHRGRACLFDVAQDATDAERAQYDMPPIGDQYKRILTASGQTKGPFTWRELHRRGLICPAKSAPKRAR